jgi:hypothetical protein
VFSFETICSEKLLPALGSHASNSLLRRELSNLLALVLVNANINKMIVCADRQMAWERT